MNRRPQAAAALLVPPARPQGGGGHDRRRPRQRRHRRALRRSYKAAQPAGLLGRRLGVRARHLLHLPEHAAHRMRRPPRYTARRVRDRRCTSAPTAPTGRRRRSQDFYADQLARLGRQLPEPPAPVTNRTHCIAWSDWATAAEGRAGERHPPRHQLLLLAAGAGCRTARACSPAPACRCASPTSTAR